jgi:putative transposase
MESASIGAGMKNEFTEAQIIGVLKEAEACAEVADLCRKHGISDAKYYNWKAKFGDVTVSDAQRLKALEAGNSKLNLLLPESLLDIAALKGVVGRKW